MKQSTKELSEWLYDSKAEAYFYGLVMGLILGGVIGFATAVLLHLKP